MNEANYEELKDALMGRRIVSASIGDIEGDYYRSTTPAGNIVLDDGTEIQLVGNIGGCSCGAGDYEITQLTKVDNIITNVEFEDDPDGDYGSGSGVYRIFVYAENKKFALAEFEGSDGNGYYGTGYYIYIKPGAA